jgi:small-conductance mechanosensitive channel
MFERLKEFLIAHLTLKGVLLGALVFAVTFVVSTAVVGFIIVKLPEDYFHPSNERQVLADRHPALRLVSIVLKNLLGVVLVVCGVIMALPGVPGPGLLTVLLGIMLLDFPGKRALELKLVRRPEVRRGIDRLREKYNKPPLLLD